MTFTLPPLPDPNALPSRDPGRDKAADIAYDAAFNAVAAEINANETAAAKLEARMAAIENTLTTYDVPGLKQSLEDVIYRVGKLETEIVHSSAPVIGLSATSLAFSATAGSTDPATQAVGVTNVGTGTLDGLTVGTILYGSGAGWITSATLDQMTAPATLTVTLATGSLTAGTYTASIPVQATVASNSPQTIAVSFAVTAATVPGTTYDYLAPAYPLPTGMTYNAATGMVEGEVFDSAYATHLPTTEVVLSDAGVRATNRTNLFNAISAAMASGSGTRIRLPAGADFGGQYNIPARSNQNSTGWVYIESATIRSGSLPEGVCVTSADASAMPQVYQTLFNVAGIVFNLPKGNCRLRFVGLELTLAPTGVTWYDESSSNINQANGFISNVDTSGILYQGTDPAQYSNDVVIDRCYIHGIAGKNLKRALFLGGARVAVVDCLIDEIRNGTASGASDGQGIAVVSGPGPYKFHHNHLRVGARGEHWMFGGSHTGIVPQDIQVTQNHLDFPLAWHATCDVKNLGELKCGIRVLVQGNLLENYQSTGVGSQYYTCNFKTEDDTSPSPGTAGQVPYTETSDVTFRVNELRNCSGGLLIAHLPNRDGAVPMSHADITCNRQLVPTSDWSHVPRSAPLQGDALMVGVRYRHNTAYANPTDTFFALIAEGATAGGIAADQEYTDNLIAMTPGLAATSWWRNSGVDNNAGITGYNILQGANTSVFSGNAVTKTTTLPAGNTAVASIVAADLDATTLKPNPTSPLIGTATAGRTPGAIHDLIDAAMALVP